MPVPSASKRVAAAAFIALGLAATAPTSGFDTVFDAAGEPPFLHATVTFAGGGSLHTMELWRDHERRILRTTDGRITTLATRTRGAGYDLVVLDHARRTSTRISRDNLYRIGAFTDWFDFGHGLRHPRGTYRLVPTASVVPETLPATPTSCRWFDLVQSGGVAHICWDDKDRMPLLIASASWQPLWRIVSLDRATIAGSRFKLNDRGYVRNNADRDVEGD